MKRPYRSITSQSLKYFARPHSGQPHAALVGPAVWRSQDWQQPQTWVEHWTPQDLAEIEAAAEQARASGKPSAELTAADFPLPRLADRLRGWRETVHNGRGFVFVRGLPVERWDSEDIERIYWCLGWHLGLPGAQNRFGELLGHVRDTGADPDDWTVREYRTREAISFHCDAADAVGLLCLRPAKQGGLSRIASSVSIFNETLRRRPDLAGWLFHPLSLDARGESGLQHFPLTPARYCRGQLRTFYHSGYFRSAARYQDALSLSEPQLELLDLYDELATSPEFALEMELRPGDFQLISNHTIVHSRTAYQDHEDPEQRRHLLRLWLSFNAQQSLIERGLTTLGRLSLLRRLATSKWRQRGRMSVSSTENAVG